MAVAAGADGIGQQQAVEPRVNHAVARTQRHTAARGNEFGQRFVGFHVHRFRIRGGVAEGLHHQIGREAQAGKVFQFVARHRAGGVLRADRSHARFAVSARAHTFAFGQTAGTADHFLRQCVARIAFSRGLRQSEHGGSRQLQGFACFGGQAAPDNQVNAAASLHFVQQHLRFQFKLGNGFTVFHDFAFIRQDVHHIAHFQCGNIYFNRQRAAVFLRIEENRCDFATQAHAAETFVRDERDVFAGMPNHGVGGRFARRACADHVAHIRHGMAFGFQFVQQFDRADFAGFVGRDAFARVFQHCQRVQRNIGARPRIGCGRQIVRIGFAVYFKHGNGNFFWHFGTRSEPFRIRPRFQHGLSVYVAFFSFFLHVVEGIKHQKRVFQAVCRNRRQFFVVQKLNQRMDVVAAQHSAEQFHRFFGRHQRALHAAFGHGGQERGFHFCRIVHTRRHAVGQ